MILELIKHKYWEFTNLKTRKNKKLGSKQFLKSIFYGNALIFIKYTTKI